MAERIKRHFADDYRVTESTTKPKLIDKETLIQKIQDKQIQKAKEAQKEKARQQELKRPDFIHRVNIAAADREVQRTSFNTPMDLIDMASGGFLNRASLSQNIGLIKDLINGEDFSKSWFGNSGLVSEEFNEQYPFVSAILNGAVDLGAGYGGIKLYKWGTTPRLIGEGASKRAYSAPFSNKVYLYGGDPEYMAAQSELPGALPYKFEYWSLDGEPVHSTKKVRMTKSPGRRLFQKAVDNDYYPTDIEVDGTTQFAFINPVTHDSFSDIEFGRDFFGKRYFVDPERLSIGNLMASFKNGGNIRKFGDGGISDLIERITDSFKPYINIFKNIYNNYKYHNLNFENIQTTNNRPYNIEDIKYINSKLESIPTMQRASILANIIEESGGDPFAVGPGGFYGLLQWSPERYKKKSDNRQEELDYQIQYILDTVNNTTDRMSWTHGGEGSGYMSAKEANQSFNNSTNINDVNKAYVLGHVRPTGGLNSVNNRNKVAQQIYNILNNTQSQKTTEPYSDMKGIYNLKINK